MKVEIFELFQIMLQGLGLGVLICVIASLLTPFALFMLEDGAEDQQPFNYKKMLFEDKDRYFIAIAGFCAGFPLGMIDIYDLQLPSWVMYCFVPFVFLALWGWVMLGYTFVFVPFFYCVAVIGGFLERKVPLPNNLNWYAIVFGAIVVLLLVYFIG